MIPFSLAAKPTPFTVTVLPGAALERPREIAALVVKFTLVIDVAAVIEPDAPTIYEPAGSCGTTKLVLHVPFDPAEIPEATWLLPKVTTILVSLAPKPEPLTVMEVPGAPLVLLREMPDLVINAFVWTDVDVAPAAPTV